MCSMSYMIASQQANTLEKYWNKNSCRYNEYIYVYVEDNIISKKVLVKTIKYSYARALQLLYGQGLLTNTLKPFIFERRYVIVLYYQRNYQVKVISAKLNHQLASQLYKQGVKHQVMLIEFNKFFYCVVHPHK